MSVRRLAEDSVQPAGFAFGGENADWALRTIQKYPEGRKQSAVIPLLMRAQEQDGWVTKAAIEHVADMLKMPLIRVLEVATFYTQFQLKPVGTKAHIQICGTTPCMLRGSDELKRVCQSKIHHDQFHPNASGTLSWEEVECLGACVNAPMAMVFKDTYEDLTPERLEDIIDAFERGEDVKVGPQIDRHLSAPVGGPTTLLSRDEGAAQDDGSAHGASPQGDGAGAAGPQSQAARPDTHAAETDPSLKTPGGAAASRGAAAADDAASVEPASAASLPRAGAEGGTVEGPTGAGDKEADAEAAAAQSLGSADGRGGPTQAHRESDDTRAPAEPPSTGDTSNIAPAATVTAAGPVDQNGDKIVGEKPQGLLAAPDGEKDDLQAIKGIGPVIEAKLNELGIFHFRQVAAWTTRELVWIDDYLNFRGRAVRENWVSQAASLDAGRPGAS